MEVTYRNHFGDFVRFNLYASLRSKVILISGGIVLFAITRLAWDVARQIELPLFGKILICSLVVVSAVIL